MQGAAMIVPEKHPTGVTGQKEGSLTQVEPVVVAVHRANLKTKNAAVILVAGQSDVVGEQGSPNPLVLPIEHLYQVLLPETGKTAKVAVLVTAGLHQNLFVECRILHQKLFHFEFDPEEGSGRHRTYSHHADPSSRAGGGTGEGSRDLGRGPAGTDCIPICSSIGLKASGLSGEPTAIWPA